MKMPTCLGPDGQMDHLEALDERLYLQEARQRLADAFERREKRQQRQYTEKAKPVRTGERIGYAILT